MTVSNRRKEMYEDRKKQMAEQRQQLTDKIDLEYNIISYIVGDGVMPKEKLPPSEYRKRQTAYQVVYNAKNKTRIPLDLNNRYDADILAYLQTVSNKQGLIKQLIRSHMQEAGYVYEPQAEDTPIPEEELL